MTGAEWRGVIWALIVWTLILVALFYAVPILFTAAQ